MQTLATMKLSTDANRQKEDVVSSFLRAVLIELPCKTNFSNVAMRNNPHCGTALRVNSESARPDSIPSIHLIVYSSTVACRVDRPQLEARGCGQPRGQRQHRFDFPGGASPQFIVPSTRLCQLTAPPTPGRTQARSFVTPAGAATRRRISGPSLGVP